MQWAKFVVALAAVTLLGGAVTACATTAQKKHTRKMDVRFLEHVKPGDERAFVCGWLAENDFFCVDRDRFEEILEEVRREAGGFEL
jgi:hypothetical protein